MTGASGSYDVAVQSVNDLGMSQWRNTRVSAWLTATSDSDTSITLTLSGHSGQWWYQANQAPDTACTGVAAGTSSVTRTGLTEHGNYIYTAYGDSNCANAMASANVVPSIDSLYATVITGITANLNISHHTEAWWYQADGGPDTGCTGVAANTATVNLSGLAPVTEYTYKAYSDSSCNTEIASETFTTGGVSVSNLDKPRGNSALWVGVNSGHQQKSAVSFRTGNDANASSYYCSTA